MFFFGIASFFHIFLFFYSMKRMVLLPSPSKGMPDGLPLSLMTTAGKIYIFYLVYCSVMLCTCSVCMYGKYVYVFIDQKSVLTDLSHMTTSHG